MTSSGNSNVCTFKSSLRYVASHYYHLGAGQVTDYADLDSIDLHYFDIISNLQIFLPNCSNEKQQILSFSSGFECTLTLWEAGSELTFFN